MINWVGYVLDEEAKIVIVYKSSTARLVGSTSNFSVTLKIA